jgi:tripeptide aminopeptidase
MIQDQTFKEILKDLPRYRRRLEDVRDIILANLVMTSEIASPTFEEEDRARFMAKRLSELGLTESSCDEKWNAAGVIPGSGGKRNIMVVAHLDTIFPKQVDHSVTVQPDRFVAPGIADNALGVATIISLPAIFEALELKLDSDITILGAARSIGHGDLEGMRFFLENQSRSVNAGICVEGVPLGRLNLSSLGMLQCAIQCRLPDEYDWTQFGASGAVEILNSIVNKILSLPLPQTPRTNIVMERIEAGRAFHRVAKRGMLQFEVRSESLEKTRELEDEILHIVAEESYKTRAEIEFEVVARRSPGGISFKHPLAQKTRGIMEALAITPRIAPSTSELSGFIDAGIPALTIGISSGTNLRENDEAVFLEPMFTGIAQLIGIILAIDRACCEEK